MERSGAVQAIEIGGERVEPGRRRKIELLAGRLPTGTPLTLPVLVVHGRRPGPRVWVSSTVHGDELVGVEIIRNVLGRVDVRALHGTLFAVPVVNVHGFLHQSRYLPDRRDLNRSFPGSARGSLAARIAHLFMTEVVGHCTHGIDLHTGSQHRANLPQIRADLDDAETRRCALAFGAPVTVHDRGRAGSLRETAARSGIPTLLYEAGEILRVERVDVEAGARGVLAVLTELGMADLERPAARDATRISHKTGWVRAGVGGMLQLDVGLGDDVEEHQVIGTIRDVFGARLSSARANRSGIVIGIHRNPLVMRGDALVHVAEIDDGDAARETAED
jgi:predicted deacylase